MEQISIKRLKNKEDILKVFPFFKHRFLSLSKGEEYCDALAKKYEENAEFYTLYSDGNFAAFVAFYCNDTISKNAFLSLIGVLEQYEGNGFGQLMLDKAVSVSRKNGMRRMALEVRKDNERAISLYKKNGFAVQKPKDETLIIMSRNL